MMYPRTRREALVSTLETENAIRKLTTTAFELWLPDARAAILPSLTAAIDDPEPDPEEMANTQPAWERVLDGLLVYGAGLLYARELFAAYTALGGTDLPDEKADVDEDPLRTRARKIVAESTGEKMSTVRKMEQRLRANPALEQLRATYADEVRVRKVDLPSSVYKDLAAKIDQARIDNVPSDKVRLTVETWMKPSDPTWAARADETARTETAGSQSLATIEAAKLRNAEIGEDLEQTWICTLDGKTRKTHWAADGQRVPLGGAFRVGRDRLRGPGDPLGSPEETANCRCRVGILAVDEPLPVENDRHTERLDGRDSVQINREGSQADEIERRAADGNVRARDDDDGVGRVASAHDNRGETVDEDKTKDVKLAEGDEEVTDPPADEEVTDPPADETEDDEVDPNAEQFRTFTDSVIAMIGTPTDDRRILAADIDFRFREFPLPLMWTKQSSGGHYDAFTVGVIESSEVRDNTVVASGYLLNTDEANEAAEQIAHGVTGPSVDLGDAEWILTDEEGNELTEEQWFDPEGELKVYETVTSAKLMGATLVSTPAFGETKIVIDDTRSPRDTGLVASITASLVAGARYVEHKFPAEFFADPKFDGPTDITITPEGRIFGHLACFGVCHVGIGNACVMAPKSAVNYAHFLTSPPVLTEDGTRQKVGRLSVGGGHADSKLGARPAAEHYDNTSTCFALVNVGEDEYGVWISGVPHPNASERQITAGLTAPLSGDWRKQAGNLELIAALAVNNPGFPILAGAYDANDEQTTLVATLGPKRESITAASGKPVDVRKMATEIVREMRAAERRDAEARVIVDAANAKTRESALGILRTVEARELITSIEGK